MLGGVDILVAHGGGQTPGGAADVDDAQFDAALQANLLTVVAMCATVVPDMRARRWGRVQAICDFVNRQISFDYMNASSTRGAVEIFHGRIGVCRDYAHLAITFCRCMNIPARYINGHLGDIGVPVVDPMDFSAWIEVWLEGPQGGQWYTFAKRK
jgi:NAD(P)-dependent dehydrogenase (short-subunit alcohol dehydrogenase family)